jgi:DNA-3-methyladenine glycosylase
MKDGSVPRSAADCAGQVCDPSRQKPWKPLAREFFLADPRVVAPALLGKILVRLQPQQAQQRHLSRLPLLSKREILFAGRIVEDEAYLGENDSAAHAAAGRTPRNAVLFGTPGFAYVYFIYGNHYCLNVSCMPEGKAGCVLIRALEPLAGLERMALNRGLNLDSTKTMKLLTSGPGRLAQAFAITRAGDNGNDLLADSSDLLLMEDGCRPVEIVTTTRVGISKSADAQLRYYIGGNAFVSGKKKRMIPPIEHHRRQTLS